MEVTHSLSVPLQESQLGVPPYSSVVRGVLLPKTPTRTGNSVLGGLPFADPHLNQAPQRYREGGMSWFEVIVMKERKEKLEV